MKKSSLIAVIVIIVVIIVCVAFGVKGHGNNDESAAQEPTSASQNEDKIPVPDSAAKFFEDYTNLQNEASRKVETGEISMEKYTDILQKGIEIAQMKEQFEQNGEDDELNQQIEEVKPYLYQFATDMDSELADKFK